MHMKTHFSSISSYCDLSLSNFLKLASLIYIYLSIYLSTYLFIIHIYPSIYTYQSIYLSIYLSFHLSIFPSIYQSIHHPTIQQSNYLGIYLFTYLSILLSIYLTILSYLSTLPSSQDWYRSPRVRKQATLCRAKWWIQPSCLGPEK